MFASPRRTTNQAPAQSLVLLFILALTTLGLSQCAHAHETPEAKTEAENLANATGDHLLEWKEVASSPLARFEAQGAVVGGKLYVLGGYYTGGSIRATERSDAYDPATDTWERIADMPEPITHAPAVVVGEEIWLIGGFVGDHPGPSTADVWKYDTRTDVWSRGPSLPVRRGAGGGAILGNTIHYFGGVDRPAGKNLYADQEEHWMLDLDQQSTGWRARAPLPVPRNHLSAAALDGKVYAIGGQFKGNETTGNRTEVHCYDPTTDTWTEVAGLSKPRGHTTSTVLAGRILVIGGTLNGNVPATDVAAYDPQANEWADTTPLPAGRKTPVADVIGGRIVSSTGNGGGPTATTWIGTQFNSVSSDAKDPR